MEPVHDVRHCRQRYSWDCGVSCVSMVLSERDRDHLTKNLSSVSVEEGFGCSTWSIDLCYLLKRYGVVHEYYTTTLGAHPGYRGQSFYDGIWKTDEARVNKRFAEAADNGLTVRQRSLKTEELSRLLRRGPLIVLTNQRLLQCDTCKHNKLSTELRRCLPWPPSYRGHYVLVVGHDEETVQYRNPSLHDHVCRCSRKLLERARKSFGTDEDVICVSDVKNKERTKT